MKRMSDRMCRPNGFYWLRSVERKDGQRIYHFYRIGDPLIWVLSLLFALLILGFCPGLFAGVRFPEHDPQIEGGMFAVWNDLIGNGIAVADIHHRVMPAMQ